MRGDEPSFVSMDALAKSLAPHAWGRTPGQEAVSGAVAH